MTKPTKVKNMHEDSNVLDPYEYIRKAMSEDEEAQFVASE